jgi:hypothetical protein
MNADRDGPEVGGLPDSVGVLVACSVDESTSEQCAYAMMEQIEARGTSDETGQGTGWRADQPSAERISFSYATEGSAASPIQILGVDEAM